VLLENNPVLRPVVLCILDGWGLSSRTDANAVALGRTPNFDCIWQECPHTQLSASGPDVGLQPGVFGNSEVGHLNIGAGRIVWQDSLIIDQAIGDGSFFTNDTLLAAMRHARENDTRLHLMGLISRGNVHSSEGHYFALLEMAAREGLRADQVLVHAFTDGRDTQPRSAEVFIARLLGQMVATGVGAVASVIGRYYAMDRDNRWERVQEAYDCLTRGIGHRAANALAAVRDAYARGENDEFIHATVVLDERGNPRPRISDNDAVLFFNYRSDRGRQLTQCFVDAEFDAHLREVSHQPGAADAEQTPVVTKFRREVWPQTNFSTMTRYAATLPCPIAFEPRPQSNGLGETVAKNGKTQLRIAETEKYPHVTYFFSGGFETPWAGEERILVSSPKVPTYDLQPEMSAPEVTRQVTAAIRSQRFDLVVINYANPDMVGHTGILEAAIKAVEEVDRGLGELMRAVEDVGGAVLVIADHGNCEQMIYYETGKPHTAHTTNLVPCILVGKGFETATLRSDGRLADVSPTLLGLMALAQPPEMTGMDLRQAGFQQVVESGVANDVMADTLAAARQQAVTILLQASSFYGAAAGAAKTLSDGDLYRQLNALEKETLDQARALVPVERVGKTDGLGDVNTALTGAELLDAAREVERENIEQLAAAANETTRDDARELLNHAAEQSRERERVLAAVLESAA
jgi:2,3-bisphosphoglycerate-independent phosphoglycerate mutase